MRINHQYLLELASGMQQVRPGARILDYGCGLGEVVEQGRAMGLEMYGADVFYAANPETRNHVQVKGFLGNRIREINDARIPFDNGFFDLVLSNMVFEHLPDMEAVLREIHRVLVPGGFLVALFPTLEVWREAHIGIPFVHRLGGHSRFRYGYTLAARLLGFGFWKTGPSRKWVEDMLYYMDNYTNYRPYKAVVDIASKHFEVRWLENHYIAFRLRTNGIPFPMFLLAFSPIRWLAKHILRRLAFAVLSAQNGSAPSFCESPAWVALSTID